jgi:hypothetical protein
LQSQLGVLLRMPLLPSFLSLPWYPPPRYIRCPISHSFHLCSHPLRLLCRSIVIALWNMVFRWFLFEIVFFWFFTKKNRKTTISNISKSNYFWSTRPTATRKSKVESKNCELCCSFFADKKSYLFPPKNNEKVECPRALTFW